MEAVAPGWTVDENGALRRETIHRMGRRRKDWDYCAPCIYEITIVVEDRRSKALGRLVVRCPVACVAGGGTDVGARAGVGAGEWLSIDEARAMKFEPDQVEARVERSALGEAVFSHFRRIAEFTPEIRPLYCEIMPDHLHLILHVVRPMKRPLGNAIAGFKTGCEKIYAKMGGKGRLFAEGFVDEKSSRPILSGRMARRRAGGRRRLGPEGSCGVLVPGDTPKKQKMMV